MNERPLVDKEYLLEKCPGKGGWTYTIIPEIPPDKNSPFGWVKVKGDIDGFEISNYHLMPSGHGDLLLFVKAEIRKKIKKEAGDYVRIILYPDNDPLVVPGEFMSCLHEDAEASEFFDSLTEGERRNYIDWIYSSKKDQTRVDRMAKTLVRLSKRLKFQGKQ